MSLASAVMWGTACFPLSMTSARRRAGVTAGATFGRARTPAVGTTEGTTTAKAHATATRQQGVKVRSVLTRLAYLLDTISRGAYIRCMVWAVEFSDEVRDWYLTLTPAGKAASDRIVIRLETQGNLLRMPHSKSLGEGLYELRFTCQGTARRITYTLDTGRRAITLTTFRKQRQNERREVLRARRAKKARDDTTKGHER
jgi:hypothetical protein